MPTDPADFWMLTSLSAGMIGFALVTYTLTNPYNAAYLPCIYGSNSGDASSSSIDGTTATTTTSSMHGAYRLVPNAELDSQSTVEYRNIPHKHTRRTVLLLYAMYCYYMLCTTTICYDILLYTILSTTIYYLNCTL